PVVAVTAVHEVDVEPTIAIEIGNTNAWAELLQVDCNSLVPFEMGEINSGSFGGVNEPWPSVGRGGLGVAKVVGMKGKKERQQPRHEQWTPLTHSVRDPSQGKPFQEAISLTP